MREGFSAVPRQAKAAPSSPDTQRRRGVSGSLRRGRGVGTPTESAEGKLERVIEVGAHLRAAVVEFDGDEVLVLTLDDLDQAEHVER